jgi:hypothetical protein
MKFGIGQAVRRVEDDALLRGSGRYVSDHLPEPRCTPSSSARRTLMRASGSRTWTPCGRCPASAWC